MRAAAVTLAILGLIFALWAGRFWLGASMVRMPNVAEVSFEEYRVNMAVGLLEIARFNRVATLLTAIAAVLSTASVLFAVWASN
jgi:hypothetical protein